jgi:hypothetical protein
MKTIYYGRLPEIEKLNMSAATGLILIFFSLMLMDLIQPVMAEDLKIIKDEYASNHRLKHNQILIFSLLDPTKMYRNLKQKQQ